MRVFVIDDAPIVLTIIKELLKGISSSGMYCEDVDDSLYIKMNKFKPDVIILDLVLKNTDGVTLASIIKKDRYLKDIPIIAISSSSYLDRLRMEQSPNFVDFISKPIVPEDLISKVRQYGCIGRLFNLSKSLQQEVIRDVPNIGILKEL